MPDTFTHIALPTLFRRWIRHPLSVPMVLIGTVLPDYLREAVGILLPSPYYSSVVVFHSLAGAALSGLFISAFFIQRQRLRIWTSLFTGQLIHFLFDALQNYQCGGGLFPLLPWFKNWQIGLYPAQFWLIVFLFSASLFLIWLVLYLIKKARYP